MYEMGPLTKCINQMDTKKFEMKCVIVIEGR